MFSYRHAFHAGNHADVLKHSVLLHILNYFNRKATPYWVIDTHAGAGIYDMNDAWANTTSEFRDGIMRLWDCTNLPPLLANYVTHVKQLNGLPSEQIEVANADTYDSLSRSSEPTPTQTLEYTESAVSDSTVLQDSPAAPIQSLKAVAPSSAATNNVDLNTYPGSPWIALASLRDRDRLRLFELHPTEVQLLNNYISNQDRRIARQVQIFKEDGFSGIKALLPPPTKRGVILIDPSYEAKSDYRALVKSIKECIRRFQSGCYMVWYPLVQRMELTDMLRRLKHLPEINYLNVSLTVKKPATGGFGLNGSGLFIINPPYTLAAALREALPSMVKLLQQDQYADFSLEIQDK